MAGQRPRAAARAEQHLDLERAAKQKTQTERFSVLLPLGWDPSVVSIGYTAHEALVIILQDSVRDTGLYRGSTIHRKFSVPPRISH